MAMKPCRECKKEISADANPCPYCGKKNPHGTSRVVVVGGGFLALAGMIWFLSGGAQATTEHQVADTMGEIHRKVAQDAVAQYEIAKRGTDAIQTCVQAGMVAAAFLQSKDEPNYTKWETIKKGDCAKAGMP